MLVTIRSICEGPTYRCTLLIAEQVIISKIVQKLGHGNHVMATKIDKEDCKPFSLTGKSLCWWVWQEGSWVESRLPVSVLQKSEVACQLESIRRQYKHNTTLKTTLRKKTLLTQRTHSTLGLLFINRKCRAGVWEPTHHHRLMNSMYPGENCIFQNWSYQGCTLQHRVQHLCHHATKVLLWNTGKAQMKT